MSFLWSDVGMSTLKDNREILQMSFFGWYIATRFLLKEQIQLIAVAFFIGALMSLFVCLAVPEIGIHTLDHPGAWKGVYGYKNNLSSMMVICGFTFFLLPINSQNILQKLYKYGGLGLAIAIVLLSTSKTSLVISVTLFLILTFYRNYRWQGKLSIVFLDLLILLLGGLVTIILSSWSELLTSLGRDPTLTGRTPMWGVALTRLMERPLLGFGRGAFWEPNSPYAREAGLAVANGFIPPHGHNGFIDLGLDVGLIGVALFAISFLIAYFRSLKVAYATTNSENLWFLAFLLFLFMNNITESFLLYKSNIYWTFYVSTALSLAKMDLSNRGRGLEDSEEIY
ncbi:O-antigen ligase family protein [Calothrix sp. PCC 6303]|uniref:O-antigen ligase family protein n=1 Tax=Calothrix sp. PCC 6303 TaxID=1170562 RepID=UPI001EF150CC|nr:O-antigen ligase family protein [Calothrix sp. PCC 6303]